MFHHELQGVPCSDPGHLSTDCRYRIVSEVTVKFWFNIQSRMLAMSDLRWSCVGVDVSCILPSRWCSVQTEGENHHGCCRRIRRQFQWQQWGGRHPAGWNLHFTLLRSGHVRRMPLLISYVTGYCWESPSLSLPCLQQIILSLIETQGWGTSLIYNKTKFLPVLLYCCLCLSWKTIPKQLEICLE